MVWAELLNIIKFQLPYPNNSVQILQKAVIWSEIHNDAYAVYVVIMKVFRKYIATVDAEL